MAEGIVSHHGVARPPPTRRWVYGRWDAHQQPPAVADLPAAIHVGQDERKGFAARRDNAWGRDGSSSPRPSGVRQHGVGNHSQDPAAGQVPGELGDRGPVVAVGEAKEGDGLQETFLLLLLALQQVLTLEQSNAKSQGDGGCP